MVVCDFDPIFLLTVNRYCGKKFRTVLIVTENSEGEEVFGQLIDEKILTVVW